MKKFSIITLLIVLSMNLISCGVSANTRFKTSSNYETALKNLCAEYGLDDAEVVVGKDFPTRRDNIQLDRAIITSEQFSSLSDEEALAFLKTMEQLQEECAYRKNGYSLIFLTYVNSGIHTYYSADDYKPNYTPSTSKTCSACNGTGLVRYYYGGSSLEAELDGYDDFEYNQCYRCLGTGKE